MTWWSHPQLGPVRPIPPPRAPRKTWRHFYAPVERWERLVDASPSDCWQEAVAAGGPGVPPGTDIGDVTGEARRVVMGHHDRHYRPAYVAELKRSGTATAPKKSGDRWVARTPGAVFVVIAPPRGAKPAEIVTAYRPHPPGRRVSWTEADFVRQADWCFKEETGMRPDDAMKRIAGELDELLAAGVSGPAELWWLAHAVVRARVPEGDPALGESLAAAKQLLSDADIAWIEQLVGSDVMEEQLHDLRAGLKDEDPEELEQTLRGLSDWLGVAVVLGRGAAAATAVARASDVLDWIDGSWLALVDVAEERSSAAATGSLSQQLWLRVGEAVQSAAAQAGEPARVARPSLVDRLVPAAPVWWEPWVSRAKSAAGTAGSLVARGQEELGRLVLAPAAAVVLGGPEEWAVRNSGITPTARRLFFVEPAQPTGEEVTENLADPEASVWLLEEPGAEALALLFVGPIPPSLRALPECLDYARDHDEVAVVTRRFSRSS